MPCDFCTNTIARERATARSGKVADFCAACFVRFLRNEELVDHWGFRWQRTERGVSCLDPIVKEYEYKWRGS